MSDQTLSDINFKNKMDLVWSTLNWTFLYYAFTEILWHYYPNYYSMKNLEIIFCHFNPWQNLVYLCLSPGNPIPTRPARPRVRAVNLKFNKPFLSWNNPLGSAYRLSSDLPHNQYSHGSMFDVRSFWCSGELDSANRCSNGPQASQMDRLENIDIWISRDVPSHSRTLFFWFNI